MSLLDEFRFPSYDDAVCGIDDNLLDECQLARIQLLHRIIDLNDTTPHALCAIYFVAITGIFIKSKLFVLIQLWAYAYIMVCYRTAITN